MQSKGLPYAEILLVATIALEVIGSIMIVTNVMAAPRATGRLLPAVRRDLSQSVAASRPYHEPAQSFHEERVTGGGLLISRAIELIAVRPMAKTKHTKSNALKIAVIPGDGIGNEVVPEGIRVLEAVGRRFDIAFEWKHFDWSCERFKKKGAMMPEDGLDRLREFDAIYLGAVGYPGVPDHVSLWGLLIPIRRGFQQYINLRPVRLFEGLAQPARRPQAGRHRLLDRAREQRGRVFLRRRPHVCRHRARTGRAAGDVLQARLRSRHALRLRPRHDAQAQARWFRPPSRTASRSRCPTGTSASPTSAKEYPKVKTSQFHIDILTAHLVRNPQWFDVIVGSNLFGDILSDLGPATTGTIAIAPGANINPEKEYPSMFEPVHGSAPDIAGKGIANPIGQIWSGAMMLDHLGHKEAGAAIVKAIEDVARPHHDVRTPDMGGKASCKDLGKALAELVKG